MVTKILHELFKTARDYLLFRMLCKIILGVWIRCSFKLKEYETALSCGGTVFIKALIWGTIFDNT